MTEYPEWFRRRADEVADDPFFGMLSAIGRSATLLIAADAPVEERRRLMQMAEALSELMPGMDARLDAKLEGLRLSEDDRMARIAEIGAEFQSLCTRNSIAPDMPLSAETRQAVKRVLSTREVAVEQLRSVRSDLKEDMKQALRPVHSEPDYDESRRIAERSASIASAMQNAFFGCFGCTQPKP